MFLVTHAWILILLITTLVLAFAAVRRSAPLPHRLLKWLIVINLFIEVGAVYLAYRYHNNHWFLNITEVAEPWMLLLIFYLGAVHPITRRINRTILWLMPAGVAVSYAKQPGILVVNTHVLVFYLFSELVSTCVFLIDGLLRSDDHTFFQDPLSWTAAGIALHCFVTTVYYGLWNFLDSWPEKYFDISMLVANGLFYAGIIITFTRIRKIDRRKEAQPII
jgi:hypothetical protein